MKGKHRVIIETKRIKYDFIIKRNITIIKGDSATGKTTLVNLLSEYSRLHDKSGITLQSDVKFIVFSPPKDIWKIELNAINDSIVFIDEENTFIHSIEFSQAIRNSTNYYVIITREPLKELPYSIKEIYEIRTSGKYHYPEKIYHEFYAIYKEIPNFQTSKNQRILIVEDKKAGFQFFSKLSNYYISEPAKTKILSVIPEEIREYII